MIEDAAVPCMPQLNPFERKQIELAIRQRRRYRYVRASVRVVEEGILVESPCCSRRVDPAGGVIDIALLEHLPSGQWKLFRRDHTTGEWQLHSIHERLVDLLEPLKNDPERVFWQ